MRAHALALILALCAAPLKAAEVELIGRLEWPTETVVGLSGIEVTEDGAGFLAISDRGWWIEGRFHREGEEIMGLHLTRLEPIIGQDGMPVAARRDIDLSDAEGLALAPNGTAWVSFERLARVWQFQSPFSRARLTPDHPTFHDHAENWQLEAMAVDPDGRVFAFSEKPLIEGFPIYRRTVAGTWTIDGYLPEHDVFAIVGADFDSDGTLYLLERKLVVGLWWQSRIRRVRLDGTLDEPIWTSERGAHQNLEGLSVWRDENGTRLTLVSDNNGSERHATEFVEFRVNEE